MLRELKKALQFDSADVSGVIEGLDVLMVDFLAKIVVARETYLQAGEGGTEDERLNGRVRPVSRDRSSARFLRSVQGT